MRLGSRSHSSSAGKDTFPRVNTGYVIQAFCLKKVEVIRSRLNIPPDSSLNLSTSTSQSHKDVGTKKTIKKKQNLNKNDSVSVLDMMAKSNLKDQLKKSESNTKSKSLLYCT